MLPVWQHFYLREALSHAQMSKNSSAGSLLTSRTVFAKMHTAKAVTASKLSCETVSMASVDKSKVGWELAHKQNC